VKYKTGTQDVEVEYFDDILGLLLKDVGYGFFMEYIS
jgi:hypothetical protein